MERLNAQEEKAMIAVWKAGEANVKSFLENMDKPRVPYTTLASTIKNLEKKGYLKSRMIGNTYLYRAAISQEEYKEMFMGSAIRNYFDNSYKNLVNFFVEQKKLSPKELKEIVNMIEKKNGDNS
jgi:predicted transcriptional regulator